MNKNNPYGYKVGYRENGSRSFIRTFVAYTYKQACSMLHYYRRYSKEPKSNRLIVNPFWTIEPITKKEILAGIMDEIPFQKEKRHRLGDVLPSSYSWSFIHCNNSSYCIFPSAKRRPTSTTSSSVASIGIPFTSKNVSNTYIPIRLFPSTNA